MRITTKKGLTLIECIISIVLLAVVLTGGLSLYFNASKIMALVTHRKLATEVASWTMENLKKSSYASLASSGPTAIPRCPTPINPDNECDNILGDLSGFKTLTVTTIGTSPNDYKQVAVKVEWTEAGRTTSKDTEINLVTYIDAP